MPLTYIKGNKLEMPKATSPVNPDWYFLRKIEHSNAYLRVRANVIEKQVEAADGKTRTEYEYDEQEIVVPIPEEVITVEQFKAFIDTKEAECVAMVSPSSAPEQPEEVDNNIRKIKDINKIREKFKELK